MSKQIFFEDNRVKRNRNSAWGPSEVVERVRKSSDRFVFTQTSKLCWYKYCPYK